ncbi:hypothetical protein HYT55_04770 [Candidatus Woesearchaeota archaeon]|nr:hypothetical protein [Candidatus Woesearchaeota archaeon]
MLIVFTDVYVPENGGLERFNYLALREFAGRQVQLQRVRGEIIPRLVDECGGYGWTGNDLFVDYALSQNRTSLRVVKLIPWPEQQKPRLCLLGPEEKSSRQFYFYNGNRVVAPDKYQNIIERYFEQSQWYPYVQFLDGQVDRQVRLGKADLAIDIVYSGRTMREERLSIYNTIFDQSGFVLLTKDI